MGRGGRHPRNRHLPPPPDIQHQLEYPHESQTGEQDMNISARNQLKGTVKSIKKGDLMAEVVV